MEPGIDGKRMPIKLLGPKLKAADLEHASIQIHTGRTMLGPWAKREQVLS